MNKNEKFLIGTVGALLAGVIIGMLVAPKEGKQTRKLIKGKAYDLSDKTKVQYSKSLEELAELADKLKEGFIKNMETVKEKATTVAENVGEKVKSVVHNA